MHTRLPDPAEDPIDSAEVPASLAGMRLDAAAAQLFDRHSRARLKGWIEEGLLLLNGETAQRPRQTVSAGDVLDLYADDDPAALDDHPQDIALDVVHADADLLIIHKPAGLTVHPGAGQRDGTLLNALLHHFPQTAQLPRAGIVHRLDKDTSGLMMVALSAEAQTALSRAIAARTVKREYTALVGGDIVAGGTIDAAIGRHPRDRLKMAVVDGGRHAVTHYRVERRYAFHTLLRVRLETGRTHQIRVHLAHIRHPIVGDTLYGGNLVRGKGLAEGTRALLAAFPRQALHACALSLDHPRSGAALHFEHPVPPDFQSLIAALDAEA